MKKIAIIGSGASAAGVILGLLDNKKFDISLSVYDIAEIPDLNFDNSLRHEDHENIYKRLHKYNSRFQFPPPKSLFGLTQKPFNVEGKRLLWNSQFYGGMTNFWGGGMFPFRKSDFLSWPFKYEEMKPYYQSAAKHIGISGNHDFENIFEDSFFNLPEIKTPNFFENFCNPLNTETNSFAFFGGVTNLALNTSSRSHGKCNYQGNCMVGCPKKSVWCASKSFDENAKYFKKFHFIKAKVYFIKDHKIYFKENKEDQGYQSSEKYDNIYIAAGAINSSEIVIRTFGLSKSPILQDNSIITLPLIKPFGAKYYSNQKYLALSNFSIFAEKINDRDFVSQISIYPFFNHLLRYYINSKIWGLSDKISSILRWRFLAGRLCLGGKYNTKYEIKLNKNNLEFAILSEPVVDDEIVLMMNELKVELKNIGIYMPFRYNMSKATSSHYGSTFPYNGTTLNVKRNGEIKKGIFLVDSSVFVTLPAISPTFTIIANAMRSLNESLND
jgi:hypothetical protein